VDNGPASETATPAPSRGSLFDDRADAPAPAREESREYQPRHRYEERGSGLFTHSDRDAAPQRGRRDYDDLDDVDVPDFLR